MLLAQTTTSFALSDLLGGFQMITLFTSILLSLILCIIAAARCDYRILVMPPILALSISLFMLGIMYFNVGVSTFSLGMDEINIDPSSELMDTGAMQASIGVNLLSLAVTGGMVFISYLVIQIRKNNKG